VGPQDFLSRHDYIYEKKGTLGPLMKAKALSHLSLQNWGLSDTDSQGGGRREGERSLRGWGSLNPPCAVSMDERHVLRTRRGT